MARLFKKTQEKKKSLWRRAVDLALTDVKIVVGGVDHESLETLEERLLAADFGVGHALLRCGLGLRGPLPPLRSHSACRHAVRASL